MVTTPQRVKAEPRRGGYDAAFALAGSASSQSHRALQKRRWPILAIDSLENFSFARIQTVGWSLVGTIALRSD